MGWLRLPGVRNYLEHQQFRQDRDERERGTGTLSGGEGWWSAEASISDFDFAPSDLTWTGGGRAGLTVADGLIVPEAGVWEVIGHVEVTITGGTADSVVAGLVAEPLYGGIATALAFVGVFRPSFTGVVICDGTSGIGVACTTSGAPTTAESTVGLFAHRFR